MSEDNYDRITAFRVEWFDETADMVREYRLNRFPDGTIEMLKVPSKMTFLARCPAPSTLGPDQLYVGSTINLYNRQMHIVSYFDGGTEDYLAPKRAQGFLLFAGLDRITGALRGLEAVGFMTVNLKSVDVSPGTAAGLAPNAPNGPCCAIEVVGPLTCGTFDDWLDVATKLPGAEEGAWFVPDTPESTKAAVDLFFNSATPMRGTDLSEGDMTLCLVKPHVATSREVGDVLGEITGAGFRIQAAKQLNLTPQMAEEFFDVYRGVVEDFAAQFKSVVDGPVLALQVLPGEGVLPGESVVEGFREFCGPLEVEIAKALRPKSLRAGFGKESKPALNAVHCTDMPEDGQLECRFFFNVLAKI
mmetsp:Transcript_17734/g.54252  ORF Transcript_17734/g.54252 Transcript_17734/m.54252 type:complete len:359 (-) Transcript_17734:135-1211(-)